MSSKAVQPIEYARPWPLTRQAWDELVDEVARLREDVTIMTGQGLEEGIVRLPVALALRRLETLSGVLDRCEVVDDSPGAAIGRRATLRDDRGEAVTYAIVVPGDGDPDKGCISADSPLGGAILGAQVGDVVEIRAPGGSWSATVVKVE